MDSVKLLWLYLLMGFVLAVSLSWAFGRNALGSVVSVQEQSGTGPYSLPCVLMPALENWGGQDTLGGHREGGYCRGKAVTANRWR